MSTSLKLNWQKNPDGLLPAIIQDATSGTILMLGYMNKESLEKTIKTNLVTFYSRSKKRLWQKGEESGNTLKLISVTTDCDNDTLLIKAIPTGHTCHTGTQSCFGDDVSPPFAFIAELTETIRQRSEDSDAQTSYTKELLNGGATLCGAKVLEEAGELVRAALREGKKRTIEEAVDLLYHILVLLQQTDITLDDIAQELSRRKK